MAVAPGIAATNAHNRNLIVANSVIGQARDYDLLFFRDTHKAVVEIAQPTVGEAIHAYGQGVNGELRAAHGVVRAIQTCAGCTAPAYFMFAGDAGPGFSGGPVLNASGQLIGIIFGYKDESLERLIYAYPMSRVQAEFLALSQASK